MRSHIKRDDECHSEEMIINAFTIDSKSPSNDRSTDRQTDRPIDRPTDRSTDRQTDRSIEEQTNEDADWQTDRSTQTIRQAIGPGRWRWYECGGGGAERSDGLSASSKK